MLLGHGRHFLSCRVERCAALPWAPSLRITHSSPSSIEREPLTESPDISRLKTLGRRGDDTEVLCGQSALSLTLHRGSGKPLRSLER